MRAKRPYRKFNGIKYYLNFLGYFESDWGLKKRKGITQTLLHRAIWEYHFGFIDPSIQIHHKDGNKQNNDISNLEPISVKDHSIIHATEKHLKNPKQLDIMREKSKVWHKTREGHLWHVAHGHRVMASLPMETHQCIECGKDYQVKQGRRKKGFCGFVCKARRHRALGRDKEKRNCVFCAKEFVTQKSSKRQKCNARGNHP